MTRMNASDGWRRVRKPQELPRPTRYHTRETTRGRGRVPLVIDGITHYTTAEAAAVLGITQAGVKYAISRGTLTSVPVNPRLNMVPEPSIEAYRRNHLGQQGRPKGVKNKPKDSTTPDTPSTGREGDR